MCTIHSNLREQAATTDAVLSTTGASSLLQLLLGPQLVGVAALLLTAVLGAGVQAGIALAADHLILVVLPGQDLQRWLNDATAQTQHQVEGGLLLDVVVSQGAAILQLLASEN
eukprot:CAMPEP_0202894468 /NCGR_PEP_ID=MMETSP1392-20130828/3875_1 /ASSEMBLY_ACC=CAM_ASM_000868 /TAXON_ID=225041 /ORGANISM="Chlamydomonas chlamydogama, Strain SAG 11-48b" /LENGTH=112 /DNA_ID=CAMNT_0049579189 /DNA_START=152 /DNA_END=487 /DNA_ORIENTATION=-